MTYCVGFPPGLLVNACTTQKVGTSKTLTTTTTTNPMKITLARLCSTDHTAVLEMYKYQQMLSLLLQL